MKIFKCNQCSAYTRGVNVKVSLWAAARISKNGDFYLSYTDDFEFPWGEIISDDMVDTDLHCEECTGKLEMIDIDKCPHVWGKVKYSEWRPPTKDCVICGVEQVGDMKWIK